MYRKAGSTNRGYVAALYPLVHGRDVDPSGVAYWTGKLDRGLDRGTLAKMLLTSHESARRTVAQSYQDLLDRAPDPSGWTHWTGVLERGADPRARCGSRSSQRRVRPQSPVSLIPRPRCGLGSAAEPRPFRRRVHCWLGVATRRCGDRFLAAPAPVLFRHVAEDLFHVGTTSLPGWLATLLARRCSTHTPQGI